MKIVAISDTHNRHNKLTIPECDLLIHAGDWSFRGKKSEVENFAHWLNKQTQCKEIVVIPGNHELFFEKGLPDSLIWFTENCPRAKLLIDSGCEIDGVKIWGSPVQPWFHDWAWNRSSFEIQKHWEKIPKCNIVITHGPVYGILDQARYADGSIRTEHLGCPYLYKKIKEIKPDIHICGHIHGGHGEKHIDGTSYYNVSICDEQYYPSNPITIIEYIDG